MSPEERDTICEDVEEVLMTHRDDWAEAAAQVEDQVIAPLLAEAERRGAEKGWDEGYASAEYMAKSWGHVDYWEDEPGNPYRADRIAQDQP